MKMVAVVIALSSAIQTQWQLNLLKGNSESRWKASTIPSFLLPHRLEVKLW